MSDAPGVRAAMTSTSKNWADVTEGDTKADSKVSEPMVFQGAGGMRTIVDYRRNAAGQRVKVTKQVKVSKKRVKVNKHVEARRRWAKFGDVAGKPPGPEPGFTAESQLEFLDLSDLRPRRREDGKEPVEVAADLGGKATSIVECRNCGEKGHWTRMCPKPRRSALPQVEQFSEEGPSTPASKDAPADKGGKPGGKTGAYVPVHLRAGAAASGAGGKRQLDDDSNTLRVSNISEDASEDDLRELFGPFGRVARVYLAKDKLTNVSRGFAFVSFHNKRDAQAAIDKLNGHGYDNLILHVEWAKPREEREKDNSQDVRTTAGGAPSASSGAR